MSVWRRILAAFDAPQFCRGCGASIRVEHVGGFDPATGQQRANDGWLWRCPRVTADLSIGGRYVREAMWLGGGSHDFGTGKPRWYRGSE